MSRPVYSVRLESANLSTGATTITAEDGYTTVIRDIDVVGGNSGGTGDIVCFISIGDVPFFYETVGPDNTTAIQWRGRQVLEPGDELVITVIGEWAVTISGYQLQRP